MSVTRWAWTVALLVVLSPLLAVVAVLALACWAIASLIDTAAGTAARLERRP